jgi:hypothetical protein
MNELNEMLEKYRDMKLELQPAIDAMKDLEKRIKAHVLDTGEFGDVDGVIVATRRGYTRKSWDSKALEGYGAAHPEIMQFCKVSETSPSVSIKVEVQS